MISREQFIKIMNKIEKLDQAQDDLNKILRVLDKENTLYCGEYHTMILDLLAEAMGDKHEWISQFVYELDYGKRFYEGCITYDDEDIILRDAGDLYDLLIYDFNIEHTTPINTTAYLTKLSKFINKIYERDKYES